MKGNYRRALETGKTILIVLLTLSAIFLVGQTKIYSSVPASPEGGWLGAVLNFFAPLGNNGIGNQTEQTGNESRLRPVRLAVRNENGCYGVQYNAEAVGDDFELRLGALLGEALVDAGTPFEINETVWREALENTYPAVYYDFLSSIPLSALSSWLTGEGNTALSGAARRMVLASGDNGTVVLYYEDGDSGRFYACSASANTLGHLTEAAKGYVPNNASFAFQNEEQYGKLDPYVMLLPTAPTPGVFGASNPIGIGGESNGTQNELLKALSFHPQISSVYQADAKVVREGTDTLRIYENGTVTFHSSDSSDPRYPVLGSGQPDEGEILEAAYDLAEDSLGLWCGEAQIYYEGMETLADGSYALYFNYVLDGAAVELYEDGYAARFVVKNNYISDFVLHFRQYKAAGTTTVLLPELQAMAAMNALGLTKSELTLCYQDSGKSEVVAGWVAKQAD